MCGAVLWGVMGALIDELGLAEGRPLFDALESKRMIFGSNPLQSIESQI